MTLYRKKILLETTLFIVESVSILLLAGFLGAAILLYFQGVVFTEEESRAILSPILEKLR